MPELAPDTRTRVALSELSGVTLMGGPATARLEYARGGDAEWDTSTDFPAVACPDLVAVSWEYSGVTVSAVLEIVSARYCSLEDIRSYRADEFMLGNTSDSDLFAARAWAEDRIEGSGGAHRFFQPVVRKGWVDRPNCTTAAVPLMGDYPAHDILEVLSAVDQDGEERDVRRLSPTQLDVRDLKPRSAAEVTMLVGMRETPPGMRECVISLAAWHLLPKVTPENATSGTVGDNFMRFVVGGVDGAATSLPEVNAFIDRYGFKDYLVR